MDSKLQQIFVDITNRAFHSLPTKISSISLPPSHCLHSTIVVEDRSSSLEKGPYGSFLAMKTPISNLSSIPKEFRKERYDIMWNVAFHWRRRKGCKVEFNQSSCWLHSLPSLLVFQQLVTLYLGGILVKVVSEIVWRNAQQCARKTGTRDWISQFTRGCKPPKGAHVASMPEVEASHQLEHYRTK